MADVTGEGKPPPLRVNFDRRLKLEFHGAKITSDGGLLAYRELDDALGLTATAASALAEGRRGKNIRHRLPGLVRQAVYGRLKNEAISPRPCPCGRPLPRSARGERSGTPAVGRACARATGTATA
jgi:hypothetical protein